MHLGVGAARLRGGDDSYGGVAAILVREARLLIRFAERRIVA